MKKKIIIFVVLIIVLISIGIVIKGTKSIKIIGTYTLDNNDATVNAYYSFTEEGNAQQTCYWHAVIQDKGTSEATYKYTLEKRSKDVYGLTIENIENGNIFEGEYDVAEDVIRDDTGTYKKFTAKDHLIGKWKYEVNTAKSSVASTYEFYEDNTYSFKSTANYKGYDMTLKSEKGKYEIDEATNKIKLKTEEEEKKIPYIIENNEMYFNSESSEKKTYIKIN